MPATGDAGSPSHPAADDSSASAGSAALCDVEPWPMTDLRRPGIDSARSAAVGSSSLFASFGSPRLGLSEWTSGPSVVVSVTGEVDIATTDQLTEALGAALHRGAVGLVCDLTSVSFLGAAGLTALLVARRRAIAGHSWFDLVCPQPFPRKVIALVGLDAVFSLHDGVAEAVGAQARAR
ncbi:MAG: STAS domain-containing protein [Acidimicrobiales bacterium]